MKVDYLRSSLCGGLCAVTVWVCGDDAALPDRTQPGGPSASSSGTTLNWVPLNRDPARESNTLFERLPGPQTGIDLVHEFPKEVPFQFLQDQNFGASVCVADFDDDGNPDVFFTNYNRGNRL